MEKHSNAQNRAQRAHAGAPGISFKEVEASEIKGVTPRGYRMMTLAEAKSAFDSNRTFRADAERAGSLWVFGMNNAGKLSPVCARAYCGLFRTDNPENRDYRKVSNTAHVPYIRDNRVEISRKHEASVDLKNALRRGVQSLAY